MFEGRVKPAKVHGPCFVSSRTTMIEYPSFTRYRSFSTIGPNSVETLKRAKDRTQFISSCRALNFREVTKWHRRNFCT